ncbi:MAG: hypothetical protein KKH99_12020, partial [Proteobacteria bacterium]|nr:hypothetical protein [Pseudomonadota bacterium]
RKRRHIVLRQLYENKMISREEFRLADKQDVASPPPKSMQNHSAFFIEYVKSNLKDQLSFQADYSTGLTIHTSLNFDLQQAAQSAVISQLEKLELRMKKNNIHAKKLECAVIAIDIKTGAILCMIGGKNFNQSNFNRAVYAKRQPGSAFKPFIYAAAINQGASQEDLILDAPLSYQLNPGKIWTVHNFSKSYLGKITYRKALALSTNTPAVRLIEQITPLKTIEFARALGISSTLSPNLSLALGTSEVNLMELTAAYIPFANMGIRVKPFSIEKIIDADSRIIYRHIAQKQAVMSRQNAAIMTDMLKAVILEGTGQKALSVHNDIAGKTGTTDNYKDALFIGYNSDTVLGVWTGNDDSTSLGKYETGAKAALPIWIDIMTHLFSEKSWQYFDIPDGTKMVYMNPDTGRLSKTQTQKTVKALIRAKDTK